MWIEKLSLEGYGPFTDKRVITFQPHTVNIVTGPNESGKSTVVRGLCAVLFGDRPAPAERARSWNGAAEFRGEVRLRTEDGRGLVMARDFGSELLRVYEDIDGEDHELFSGRITPGTRRGSVLLPYESLLTDIFGFSSRNIFEQTLCVHQTVVPTVFSGELREIASGSARADYAAVRDRLLERCDEISQDRPPDSGQRRLTKPRALEIETERLRELESEIEQARRAADELADLEERRDRAAESARRAVEDRNELRDRIGVAERYLRALERFCSVRDEHTQIMEKLNVVQDAVRRAETVREELDREYSEFTGVTDEFIVQLGNIEGLEHSVRELDGRVNRMSDRLRDQCARRNRLVWSWFIVAAVLSLSGLGLLLTQAPAIAFYGLIGGGVGACLAGAITLWWTADMLDQDRRDRDSVIEERHAAETRLQKEMDLLAPIIKDRPIDEVRAQYAKYRAKLTEHTRLLAQAEGGVTEKSLREKAAALGADHGALRSQLDTFGREHAFVRQWNEDVHQVDEFIEAARRELAHAEIVAADCGAKTTELDRELAVRMAGSGGDVARLCDLRDETADRINVYRIERDALYLAWRVLTDSIDEFSRATVELVNNRASNLFKKFTSGRYIRVELDDHLEPLVSSPQKNHIRAEMLSTGACDQLFLALRLAFAEVLAGRGKLPIILDDPFANFDIDRLDIAIKTLETIAHDRQVILLTHDTRIERIGTVVARLEPSPGQL